MCRLTAIILLPLVFMNAAAAGESFYPVPTAVRAIGFQQGAEGMCAATAEAGALEHAFSARGLSVSVSAYFAHLFNWQTGEEPDVNVERAPQDAPYFQRWQSLIPEYMLPEDGRGIDFDAVGAKPAIHRMLVEVSGFPPAATFGFKRVFYTFQPGYSNSIRDINSIKNLIRQKKAVSIVIDSTLLASFFNSETGMLSRAYNAQELMTLIEKRYPDKPNERRTRHAVALVGFDDDLQGGSFIIRNSWNENTSVLNFMRNIDIRDPDYAFKAKLDGNRNLPGYYAIPYAYYLDLMKRKLPTQDREGDGGVVLFDLNYEAFAAAYNSHERNYEIVRVPFTCNWNLTESLLKELLRKSDKEFKEILNTQRLTPFAAIFNYATLSRSRDGKMDRMRDLYSGSFDKFYCPRGGQARLPATVISSPEFEDRVRELTAMPNDLGAWLRFYKLINKKINIKES